MNPFLVILLTLSFILAGCSEPGEVSVQVDPAISYDAFEDAAKNTDAKITSDGDWKIVSRMENGNRVYWFVAPDVDNVSPALFRKTIHAAVNNEQETVIVSNCEAPKQICDNLMVQFKSLSEKYK